MKVSAEKIEGSRVALSIEAPSSIVDESLDRAYKSVVKRINVPGFRRGKAPRMILERHYGKEVLYDEAIKEVLPQQYEEALKEANITPIDEPEFDEVSFKQGEPITFKAIVYVRPEVVLEDYTDVSVPYEVQAVTDEDVDQQIGFLRERMAELSPIEEDQALDQADYATCHVKGIEGGTFKADIDQDLSYVEVGREYGIVPGLSEALKGMKKGDTKEFTGTYPAKEGEEPRQAKFSVEVKDCYRKHMPSDEEFLKNVAKTNLDEVRADIKQRLDSMRADAARKQHSDKVEEAILAKATLEIPDVMIERQEQDLIDRFGQRLQEANTSFEAYLKSTGRTVEDLRSEFHKEAERDVRRDLVLDAVGDKENTQVSPETMNSVVEAFARQTGKDAEAIRTTLELRGALERISNDLRRMETMKLLAIRAAEKAGTPIPLDEVKPEAEDKVEAADAGSSEAAAPAVESEAAAPDAEAETKAQPEAKPEAEAMAESEATTTQSEEPKAAPKRKKKAAKAE